MGIFHGNEQSIFVWVYEAPRDQLTPMATSIDFNPQLERFIFLLLIDCGSVHQIFIII